MPYIKQEQRLQLATQRIRPTDPGQLNYMITMLCVEYCENIGFKYQTANDVLGALEGAKLEFYRRIVSPYEDKKIKENGDVYTR